MFKLQENVGINALSLFDHCYHYNSFSYDLQVALKLAEGPKNRLKHSSNLMEIAKTHNRAVVISADTCLVELQ